MTDYTPTTDDVRNSYVENSARARQLRGEQFDRWLRKVKAEAWDEAYYARAENMAREIWEDGDLLLNPYQD